MIGEKIIMFSNGPDKRVKIEIIDEPSGGYNWSVCKIFNSIETGKPCSIPVMNGNEKSAEAAFNKANAVAKHYRN